MSYEKNQIDINKSILSLQKQLTIDQFFYFTQLVSFMFKKLAFLKERFMRQICACMACQPSDWEYVLSFPNCRSKEKAMFTSTVN